MEFTMTTRAKDAIISFLIERSPNYVSESLLRRRLSLHDEAALKEAIEELIRADRIVAETDPREAIGRPVRYFKLKSYDGLPVRETIKIGDIEIQRLLSASKVGFFPEDFNEQIERLADYTNELEQRFVELVKKEQRRYWANVITIFGVFVAILSFVLVGIPKIATYPNLSFWSIFSLNLAQVLPIENNRVKPTLLTTW